MSHTSANGHAAPPNISELARRSGYSRATVRQRLRQGWHPDDFLPVKPTEIHQECHDVARPAISVATRVATEPVDLVQLKREIQDWVKLHQEVERLRTGREPYNPRMVFFLVGVAFFVLLAYAAVS